MGAIKKFEQEKILKSFRDNMKYLDHSHEKKEIWSKKQSDSKLASEAATVACLFGSLELIEKFLTLNYELQTSILYASDQHKTDSFARLGGFVKKYLKEMGK